MLLDIHDLDLTLQSRPPLRLLRRVSVQVAPGQIVGLVGESGAGKSMVGRVTLGLAPANTRVTHGRVVFDGRDITEIPERQRRQLLGREIAFIPQNAMSALNPVARIGPQIIDVLRTHRCLDAIAAQAQALSLLRAVQLHEPERILRQYPHELSGGMRQRVLIAIAFSCAPKLIIADEPTTALDVTVQKQILQLIKRLQRDFAIALLFITHDLGVAAKLCDRVGVMHAGRVLEFAGTEQMFANPAHDYTKALFAATPRVDRPAEALQPVSGALRQRLADEARRLDAAECGDLW